MSATVTKDFTEKEVNSALKVILSADPDILRSWHAELLSLAASHLHVFASQAFPNGHPLSPISSVSVAERSSSIDFTVFQTFAGKFILELLTACDSVSKVLNVQTPRVGKHNTTSRRLALYSALGGEPERSAPPTTSPQRLGRL